MRRIFAALAVGAILAGCAADNAPDSSAEEVAAAAFRASDAPSLTLFTMINNRTGRGGHSALMVSGTQRVIFDPAGSFRDERVTERGDVLYGITPGWLNAYKSAHARVTHHVVSQKISVTPEQAAQALRLVQSNGSVAGGFCAQSTIGILNQISGLPAFGSTFYPEDLMSQFAALPGVQTDKLFEDDSGNVIDGLQAAALAQAE